MKLLFRQRFFSWFDSYDIYDEDGNTVYVVKGQLSWGHCLKIFDTSGQELGTVKEKILTWLPKFELYEGSSYVRAGDRRGKMLPEFKLSARQRESGVEKPVKAFWESLNDEQ